METRRKSSHGFSLVEVTIALGLLSFTLLAILSLLSVGLDSNRTAQVATTESVVANYVLSEIRLNNPADYTGSKYYFRFDGSPTTASDNPFFECTVEPKNIAGISAINFRGVNLTFTYPATAPLANRSTNVLHASIVRQN